MFEEYSDQQLKDVYSLDDAPSEWRKDNLSWLSHREHALGEYWRRRLDGRTQPLEDDEIHEVLSYLSLATAKGVLGDAARQRLLSVSQCNRVLAILNPDDWAFQEINLRLTVERARAQTGVSRRESIRELLSAKREWPVIELVPELTAEEARWVGEAVRGKGVLTKRGRHNVRQAIQKVAKVPE